MKRKVIQFNRHYRGNILTYEGVYIDGIHQYDALILVNGICVTSL